MTEENGLTKAIKDKFHRMIMDELPKVFSNIEIIQKQISDIVKQNENQSEKIAALERKVITMETRDREKEKYDRRNLIIYALVISVISIIVSFIGSFIAKGLSP